MLSIGAPIDEVWGSSAQGHARSRMAPGSSPPSDSSKCRKPRRSRSAPAPHVPGRPFRPQPSEACDLNSGSSLCSLYDAGYTNDLMSSMGQRTDVGGGLARTRSEGGALRKQVEHDPFPMQPIDSSVAGMYDFEVGGPVNFYEDEDEEDDDDNDDNAKTHSEDRDDVHSTLPERANAMPVRPQAQVPPLHANVPVHLPAKQPSSHVSANTANNGNDGSCDHADIRTYIDIGLYVVSGVILIFLLEQFIQVGTRLRGA